MIKGFEEKTMLENGINKWINNLSLDEKISLEIYYKNYTIKFTLLNPY